MFKNKQQNYYISIQRWKLKTQREKNNMIFKVKKTVKNQFGISCTPKINNTIFLCNE